MLELVEDRGDLASERFSWSVFLLCGDPADPAHAAFYAGADPATVAPLSCPDNFAFDPRGRLWIATDGQGSGLDCCDSLYAVAISGPERGRTRRFFNAPAGAEVAGPEFTPDGKTLFLSVQHPGAGGGVPNEQCSWPDPAAGCARSSVLAIRAEDGGPIGG